MPVFGIDDIYFDGIFYHIDQVTETQLFHEVGAVLLHRLGAHKEKFRYLLGGVSLDHQPEYLLFTLCQGAITGARRCCLPGLQVRIDDFRIDIMA